MLYTIGQFAKKAGYFSTGPILKRINSGELEVVLIDQKRSENKRRMIPEHELNKFKVPEGYIDVNDYANKVGISSKTVFKRVNEGSIKCFQLGKRKYIPKDTDPFDVSEDYRTPKRKYKCEHYSKCLNRILAGAKDMKCCQCDGYIETDKWAFN